MEISYQIRTPITTADDGNVELAKFVHFDITR